MQFVFAGGSKRSGTTLLHSILCSTQATPPPAAEDGTVRYLALAYEDTLRRFDRHASFFFEDRDKAHRIYRQMTLRYLHEIAGRWPEASHLVIKQPQLTRHFPTLAKLLPRARFVITVRDPRDTVASLAKVARREHEQQARPGHRTMGIPGLVRMVAQDYQEVLNVFGARNSNRVMWVRYEDMVRAPETTAQRLGDFTGIDLSGYQSGEPWRGWADGTVNLEERRKSPFFSPLWGQAVTDTRVGTWPEVLDAKQEATVTRALAPIMRAFGYGDVPAAGGSTTTQGQE
jgi:protein-tyrosine sulfotransferase